jgi:hypothetical protein
LANLGHILQFSHPASNRAVVMDVERYSLDPSSRKILMLQLLGLLTRIPLSYQPFGDGPRCRAALSKVTAPGVTHTQELIEAG